MMTKIIFSDFDYTLLNYYSDKNYFDDYQIGVLSRLKEKGIKFCIVTGRSVYFFEQFPRLMEVVDYIIGSNGAFIYDIKNKNYLYKSIIDNDEFRKLVNYSIDNRFSFLLDCLGEKYYYGEWIKSYEYIKEYQLDMECECGQFVLGFDMNRRDEVANFIEYFNSIVVNNVSDFDDRCTIDINAKDVSKGKGISILCEYLNIDKEDTICFGDGPNDISMFNSVGKSISVDNANDNVKTKADEVALSCDEYGVYKYIDDNILK